jgi:hypothetical protein
MPPDSVSKSTPGAWSHGSVRQYIVKSRSPCAIAGYSMPAETVGDLMDSKLLSCSSIVRRKPDGRKRFITEPRRTSGVIREFVERRAPDWTSWAPDPRSATYVRPCSGWWRTDRAVTPLITSAAITA